MRKLGTLADLCDHHDHGCVQCIALSVCCIQYTINLDFEALLCCPVAQSFMNRMCPSQCENKDTEKKGKVKTTQELPLLGYKEHVCGR